MHILNSSVAGDLMQKIHRFIDIALISFTLAACVLLYTVGLDQEYLGYERRWTYPLFFALIPAFCLRAGLRYLFKKKNQRDQNFAIKWSNAKFLNPRSLH